ncbi:probable lysosomal cobalamin transporter [Lingula anatina]|uniref:Probable lysosomal cobalamin transporter n=1 Tax=Lingula anatina TaxID=7574 RepID=A0A1S3H3E9_LINAN|nr:probable lysosomal cobalamin transporter [Lingula anatina]|eukprot:XP_013380006.1 probable lysosomal cobalamin transporter [Lingula anatina]
MADPVVLGGWISFACVVLLTLIFSALYIRLHRSKTDSERSSTITSVLAVAVALLTSALVPVDIFLVAFMKDPDGKFKEWAESNVTRQEVETSVLYTYYTMYALITFFLFFALPFVYFYYEEKEDENPGKKRFCSAFLYTLVFLFIAGVLLLVGAFAPVKTAPDANLTEWKRLEFLFKDLATNDGEDALSFLICSLTLIGLLGLMIYTAYGMTAWPVNLIRGTRGASTELSEVSMNRARRSDQIEAIRNKYGAGRRISARDRRQIESLEDEEHLLERQERHLQAEANNCCSKCLKILRPLEMIAGIVFFLVALLIFLSLLLTNIDKAMHSYGWRMGYALPHRTLPNPLDIVLVFSQQVFPLDYILMAGVIMYFFFCSMAGIHDIGIWFFWIKMYKIRPRKTRPQGLLMMCFLLMLIVLATNVIIYELTPQYSMYGSQHYVANSTKVTMCSTSAPEGDCVMTRFTTLLTRFFYKVWFFGACYYWAGWVFLAVIPLSFVISLCRRRKSSINGQVEEDDFDSDEELLSA